MGGGGRSGGSGSRGEKFAKSGKVPGGKGSRQITKKAKELFEREYNKALKYVARFGDPNNDLVLKPTLGEKPSLQTMRGMQRLIDSESDELWAKSMVGEVNANYYNRYNSALKGLERGLKKQFDTYKKANNWSGELKKRSKSGKRGRPKK